MKRISNWFVRQRPRFVAKATAEENKELQGITELEKRYLEVHAERTALLRQGFSKNDQKLSKLLEEEQNLLSSLNNFWGSGR